MKLSVVIATHDRRDALARTLERLCEGGGLAGVEPSEVIVVDDASSDGTPEMVRQRFEQVDLIVQTRNTGPCAARNAGITAAAGEYVLLLDDDSYPLDDAAARIVRYLDEHPATGAVVGRVERADGSAEASALPAVMIGCAACVRKSVLDEVGGFPPEFIRQAEEYDLSFRIWDAGYRIERFEDVVFRHEKADGGRASALIHRLDVRNNLILAARYLPPELSRAYRADWTQRYTALAKLQGHKPVARHARWEASWCILRELWRRRPPLAPHAIEAIFEFQRQAHAVEAWARQHRIRRVAIADYGKNLYATYRACLDNGLQVRAILDGHGAFDGLWYRQIEIAADAVALGGHIDGVVLSNINPAQIAPRMAQLKRRLRRLPILSLWSPRTLDGDAPSTPDADTPQTSLGKLTPVTDHDPPPPRIAV